MKHLTLTKETAELLGNKLKNAGYVAHEKHQYIRFSKSHGDATYITHSLNIIRASKNTDGQAIIENAFGKVNGKASELHDDKFDSWFFNGYSGKAGTIVY